MAFLSWILFGAIAGWIASLIMGRSERMGCLANVFVGIVGAMVGGFLTDFFGGGPVADFNFFSSLVVAVIGAVILLGLTGWWQQRS